MKVAVCIKQVPDTTEIRIDPVKKTLIRTGVPSIMNPFDVNAVEAALKLKDQYGGEVTVISMGPPQAKVILREALAMGADHAYLVTDRAFGGSDTYATSYILSQALKKFGPSTWCWAASRPLTATPARRRPPLPSIWAWRA